MSRHDLSVGTTLIITRGSDHAVGPFVQVADRRYAKSGQDEQGEGYVLDWDHLFGFSTNLIGAKEADLGNNKRLEELTDIFCKTLKSNTDAT